MIISNIYKRAFNVLSKMPFKLWGLSLLSSLLTILVLVFGGAGIYTTSLYKTLQKQIS